jgi:Na+/H+-dicarboxylate symporter
LPRCGGIALNVTGDLMLAAVVSKGEGEASAA